ncbi:MAG: hypothetical protein COB04_01185 [Gammaproteobacteria bacterium]|nr:MAG: hypothetical protein COB04_01185 [Gammaproteobacteria bacterium]
MQGNKVDISKSQLKSFGIMMGCMISILFGVVLPYLYVGAFDVDNMPVIPWVIGLSFIVCALILPTILKPVYFAWMKFGGYLGWFNTRLILSLVFVVMFIPFALVMKVIRRDTLARKYDLTVDSYRQLSVPVAPESMERPF